MRTILHTSGFILIISCLLMATGCTQSSITATNSKNMSNTTVEYTANIIQNVQKTIQNERISPPFSKDESGIVYEGYLLSSYDSLYGSIGGFNLERFCESLDIEMVPMKDTPNDKPEYKYEANWLPSSISVTKGDAKLTLKVKGSVDEYFKNTHYPQVPYLVYKNGKLVKSITVFQYKGEFYFNSLEELLNAIEIKYFTDRLKGITYVGSDKETEIKGRLLDSKEIELKPGEKSTVKLLYNYDTNNKPNYKEIELRFEGKENFAFNVFNEYNRGRSDYYYYGTLTECKVNKDTLLQVSLSDAPTEGNIDAAIYKYVSNDLVPVFNKNDYEKLLSGNMTLETDNSGNCTFNDKLNNVNQALDIKSDKQNAIFTVDIRDERIEQDSTGKCLLLIRASAVDKVHFFYVTIESEYIGGRFHPLKALLTKSYYFLGDAQPILYEYGLSNMSFDESKGPDIRDNLKSIEIENLNSKSNTKVTLKLPKGWYAKEYINDIVPEFEFNAEKNKIIKKVYSFEFYNSMKMDKYKRLGFSEFAGWFEMPSYYRDQPEITRFPNHCQVKTRVYSGDTVLGQGEIFILNSDIPDELRTDKYSTHDMVYAWIPIMDEALAYNLSISVPLGEKDDDYIEMVKNMLNAGSKE
jgi:hypothetical protein